MYHVGDRVSHGTFEGVSHCGYDTGYGIGDADQLGLDELHIAAGELNKEIKKLKFLSTKDFGFFILLRL